MLGADGLGCFNFLCFWVALSQQKDSFLRKTKTFSGDDRKRYPFILLLHSPFYIVDVLLEKKNFKKHNTILHPPKKTLKPLPFLFPQKKKEKTKRVPRLHFRGLQSGAAEGGLPRGPRRRLRQVQEHDGAGGGAERVGRDKERFQECVNPSEQEQPKKDKIRSFL